MEEKPSIEILHLDDSLDFLEYFSLIMKKNFVVTSVSSPFQALNMLETRNFDCFLTDYDMPGLNGLEVLKRAKKIDPDVPVILLTGQGNEQVARDAFKSGASDYYTKDFSVIASKEKLKNSISTLVINRKSENTLREIRRFRETLVSNLPGMAYRCSNDPDWTMEYVSRGSIPLTGYSPEELTNNRVVAYGDLIHPDQKEIVWNTVQQGLKPGQAFQIKYKIKSKSDNWRWVWEQGSGVFDKDGKLRALEGFITDITELKQAQDQLEESELYYHTLIANSQDLFVIWDSEGTILYLNPSLESVLGYKPEELIGNNVFEMIHPADQPRIKKLHHEAVAGYHRFVTNHCRLHHKNGTWRILKGAARVMVDSDGEIRILVNSRDITEHIQNENELLSTLKAISDLVFRFDREGRFIYSHHEDPKNLLMPTQEFIGKKHSQVMPENIDSLFWEAHKKNAEGKIAEYEYNTNVDDSNHWFSAKLSPVFINEEFDGSVAVVRDITRLKQAEQMAEESRLFLDNILNSLDDQVFVKDENLKFVAVNNKVCEMVGLPRSEILGKSNFELFPRKQPLSFKEKDLQVLKTGKPNVNEEVITIHGKDHYFSTKNSLMIEPGSGKKFIAGTIRDMTREKLMEKHLIAVNEELSQFTHMVSHDLKNPLNNIQGYLMVIQENKELFDQYFDRIVDLCARLTDMVDSLLKLSRAGKIIEQHEPVDTGRLIKEAFHVEKPGNFPARLTFDTEMPIIKGDSVRLEQVILNLIQNAFKYGITDGKELEIRSGWNGSEKEPVIYLCDNGPGIKSGYLKDVFNPGFVLKKDKGTGFGLAVAKKIILAHQGRIWAESPGPLGGAAFYIKFPSATP